MKIVMVTEFLASRDMPRYGGVDMRTIRLAQHLVNSGNEVFVITSRQKEMDLIEDFDGVTLIRTGRTRGFVQGGAYLDRLRFSRDAISHIVRLRPDIVDAIGFVSFSGAYKGAHSIGVPAVASVLEVWIGNWIQNMGLFDGMIGSILEKRYLTYPFDRYICISRTTRQELMEKIGIHEDRIGIVYPGIDISSYRSVLPARSGSSPTLITISRMVAYKKLDLLIKAIAELKLDYPDIQLKIVGEGPLEASLRQLAARLEVSGNIDFLGKIIDDQDIIRLLKGSDIFVLPSVMEGFGMVIVEAMAAGIPYVASSIPTIREITGGGTGGLLFEPGNGPDMTRKVRALLEDRTLRKRITSGNDVVINQYDWKEVGAALEHNYRLLV